MPEHPSSPTIAEAVAILRGGGLLAIPTETVYGLAADARNAEAVARIFALKGRPSDHPLIVHIAGTDAIEAWASTIPESAKQLATHFWPGPLTLILKKRSDVPDAVTGGQDTVGLRSPDHPLTLSLLRAFGGGLAAPSANRFGRISPTSASHVRDEFGEMHRRFWMAAPALSASKAPSSISAKALPAFCVRVISGVNSFCHSCPTCKVV